MAFQNRPIVIILNPVFEPRCTGVPNYWMTGVKVLADQDNLKLISSVKIVRKVPKYLIFERSTIISSFSDSRIFIEKTINICHQLHMTTSM